MIWKSGIDGVVCSVSGKPPSRVESEPSHDSERDER
jgi:hypothetical protein